MERSCTSSNTIWVTFSRSGSTCKRRSSTPVVQNMRRVRSVTRLSKRIWYPTTPFGCLPRFSPRSEATRSATPIALIRLGCVQIILQCSFRDQASSKINCGTCVVLPQPVSPLTTTTWLLLTASKICSFIEAAGRLFRNVCKSPFGVFTFAMISSTGVVQLCLKRSGFSSRLTILEPFCPLDDPHSRLNTSTAFSRCSILRS
mmetsp:Transcript_37113/g.60472  ORF Transcript_37113/g.60472 Transcript_37113/m.60472 type:complete len:202 (+) Transcript_37113:3743-4348(+)